VGKHLVKTNVQLNRSSRKHQGTQDLSWKRARSNDTKFMACTKKCRRCLEVQDARKLIELSISLSEVKEENITRLA